jgi:hypothetical protein
MASQALDIPTLESWLWDAACSIRGVINAPKHKESILLLLFYKRLSDVYAGHTYLDKIRSLDPVSGSAIVPKTAVAQRCLLVFLNSHSGTRAALACKG